MIEKNLSNSVPSEKKQPQDKTVHDSIYMDYLEEVKQGWSNQDFFSGWKCSKLTGYSKDINILKTTELYISSEYEEHFDCGMWIVFW